MLEFIVTRERLAPRSWQCIKTSDGQPSGPKPTFQLHSDYADIRSAMARRLRER